MGSKVKRAAGPKTRQDPPQRRTARSPNVEARAASLLAYLDRTEDQEGFEAALAVQNALERMLRTGDGRDRIVRWAAELVLRSDDDALRKFPLSEFYLAGKNVRAVNEDRSRCRLDRKRSLDLVWGAFLRRIRPAVSSDDFAALSKLPPARGVEILALCKEERPKEKARKHWLGELGATKAFALMIEAATGESAETVRKEVNRGTRSRP